MTCLMELYHIHMCIHSTSFFWRYQMDISLKLDCFGKYVEMFIHEKHMYMEFNIKVKDLYKYVYI